MYDKLGIFGLQLKKKMEHMDLMEKIIIKKIILTLINISYYEKFQINDWENQEMVEN